VQAAELAARAASAARAAASTAAIGKSSEFYGVTWHAGKGKWIAHVRRGDTTHHIDYFDVEKDAAGAVDDWLLEHGEDRENFDAKGNRIVRQSTDSSIYRGVTWDKNKRIWVVKIYVGNNKTENIGQYDTQKEAAEAYDKRAWQLDKPTNFRFDGTLNELGADGKVVPQRRDEIWTLKLSRQSA
jgi:hypothetical protein